MNREIKLEDSGSFDSTTSEWTNLINNYLTFYKNDSHKQIRITFGSGVIAAVCVSTEENFIENLPKFIEIAKLIASKINEKEKVIDEIYSQLLKKNLQISASELKSPVLVAGQNLQSSTDILKDMIREAFNQIDSNLLEVEIDNQAHHLSLNTMIPVANLINPLSLFKFKKLLDFGKGPIQEVPFFRAHDSFEKCAQEDPERVAVEQEGIQITYGELDRRADCVAAGLIERGVKVGDFVAVLTKRSIEMVIAIFGIVKAGGAFVLVDFDLPFERIQYILDIASCHTILFHPQTPQNLLARLPHNKIVNINELKFTNQQGLLKANFNWGRASVCRVYFWIYWKTKGCRL
ncbi:hypothetical protein HDV01_003048 [Terramyces sp. JEL0728]|nr:hypothetical protein HDV01_003048 [Terramyces sp. JEL0728]